MTAFVQFSRWSRNDSIAHINRVTREFAARLGADVQGRLRRRQLTRFQLDGIAAAAQEHRMLERRAAARRGSMEIDAPMLPGAPLF
jgi:hypothetical protein